MPLTVAALTMLVGVGCFTGPINQQPKKPVIQPAETVRRGAPASFNVTTDDPDRNDVLTVGWAWLPEECPEDPVAQNWDGQLRSLPVMVDANMTLQPFCICAIVVDNHNAVNADCVLTDPRNSPPVARIKVVAPESAPPYPLYSHIQVSGEDSFDPDPTDSLTTFSWALTSKPATSTAIDGKCAGDPRDNQRCFDADAQGAYTVSLTVSDTLGATNVATPQTFIVLPDRLPCIRQTHPDFLLAVGPPPLDNEFRVEIVEDDGEPYPQDPLHPRPMPRFTWWLGKGDLPLIDQLTDYFKLPVAPANFSPGERGRVRVEIADRNPSNQIAIEQTLRACGDQPECAGAPNCLQRVTWTVQY